MVIDAGPTDLKYEIFAQEILDILKQIRTTTTLPQMEITPTSCLFTCINNKVPLYNMFFTTLRERFAIPNNYAICTDSVGRLICSLYPVVIANSVTHIVADELWLTERALCESDQLPSDLDTTDWEPIAEALTQRSGSTFLASDLAKLKTIYEVIEHAAGVLFATAEHQAACAI